MPFWRPKDPQTHQERAAVEDAQMLALEASLPSDPAKIDELYTYHLTMAARLRTERSAGLMARNALENAQVTHAESAQYYMAIRRMIEVFKNIGVPGIDVDVLREVKKDDTSSIHAITLTDYVGMHPTGIFNKRYLLTDRIKGWVLLGEPMFDGENEELPPAQKSLDPRGYLGVYDGSSDVFSITRPLLVTETGDNWSGILTPAGVADGSLKGVVEDEANSFQREYTNGDRFAQDDSIKAIRYYAWTMQKKAEHYGYDSTADKNIGQPMDTSPSDIPEIPLTGGIRQFDYDE